ncbi:uncharacterized protein LOC124459874 [Drosophila willistoni]|uniref:uncharacterized protein LOC124459874 n=1 Tax=Drosophila willistoni TaxID=7260 RepID=UPI001F075B96|nr:uncharacterized protein LOC124459874 [Drosophila willistoni]
MAFALTSCCHCCRVRTGCISSAIWMIIYYSLTTGLMFHDMAICNTDEVAGFWYIGISFAIMIGASFIFLCGTLCKSIPLIILFLVLQVPPITVETIYMLVAIIYGIELNIFILYTIPLIMLGYFDLVAYSYMVELQQAQREAMFHHDDEEEY